MCKKLDMKGCHNCRMIEKEVKEGRTYRCPALSNFAPSAMVASAAAAMSCSINISTQRAKIRITLGLREMM